ncbi:anti-sigma factor [Aquipluma nitroreducens]|uniref:Anti-sigma factor n=1 Tax=Aquipluma nitroreducens TaxID=2010828 RepID=A0A5K7S3R0_9BACT|nr:FecR domain-containing protein [Aquipluma nitroreducens]BBE16183.1 anti-sigma factor [Aquipluma nitroreducens]
MQKKRMTDEILYKYISDQASADEALEVREWTKSSDVRKNELARLKNAWIISGLDHVVDPKIKNQEIEKIWYIIRQITINEQKKATRLRFVRYAAAILLIIGLSETISYFVSNLSSLSNSEITEIIVPKGQRSTVVLSDGSTVQLNSDSRLRFPSFFKTGKRKVTLIGEGFFNVAHDKAHPFVVEATGLQIEVLGTSFNVSNYPNDKIITTYLQSGKVKIIDNSKNNVFLNPSEAYSYSTITHKSVIEKIDDQHFSDWTKGLLTIKGENIGELAKKLERRFDIQIVFGDEDVKQHLYTGSIKDQDLKTVLDALEFASAIKYERTGTRVILSSK